MTGQYGASLALTAATRQIDHTLQVQYRHGKGTVRQTKALMKAAESSSANYNFSPGPQTNLSHFQYHQVFPITLTEWLRALFEKL